MFSARLIVAALAACAVLPTAVLEASLFAVSVAVLARNRHATEQCVMVSNTTPCRVGNKRYSA